MIIVGKGAAALHRQQFIALERVGSLFTVRLAPLQMLANYQANEKKTELLKDARENLKSRTMKNESIVSLFKRLPEFLATTLGALTAGFICF